MTEATDNTAAASDTPNGTGGVLPELHVELGVGIEETQDIRRQAGAGRQSPLCRIMIGEPWEVPEGHPWHDGDSSW